jgi:DNA polymerase I-like protein with 3'-5' exonuclease and polymerase domains/ribosomal protein S27E
MKPIRTTSFDARSCANALHSAGTVVIDLETTGVRRHDQIVAAGVLNGRDAHILTTNEHRDLSSTEVRLTASQLRAALSPLSTRSDLRVVMHNAAFDVGMLERAGIPVNCRVIDTLKLMKLADSDRGHELDDGSGNGIQIPRVDRATGDPLTYRLKDLARTTLRVSPLDFPGAVNTLPIEQLVRYLKSDLVVTSMLYQHALQTMESRIHRYSEELVEPVTPVLVRMSETGVTADAEFINSESTRMLNLMQQISCYHKELFGQPIDVGDYYLRRWIYISGIRCRRVTSGKNRQLSLKCQDLLKLRTDTGCQSTRRSLELIHDYKQLQSLMTRLRSLAKHVCPRSRRIHSGFNDLQSSGRVSSSRPNLQQIAGLLAPGARKQLYSEQFSDTAIKSRNVLIASDNHTLVACDISQADIRVLAHMVESFQLTGDQHVRHLHIERTRRVGPQIEVFNSRARNYIQPQNRKRFRCESCWHEATVASPNQSVVECGICGTPIVIPPTVPPFDPLRPCRLADDFRNAKGDFYTTATRRMLGRDPRDKTERNHMKQTILGIVNGMSANALADRLDVSLEDARGYLLAFSQAYPQVDAYKELSRHEFAITGRSWTFAGHHRRVTPHYWMVNESEVEIFVSYRGADKLWIRVVPLRPNRHTLTCWVLSVVDVAYGSKNEGKEIYHHEDGRISQAKYRFFREANLIYRLPVRNISWRLIRRVRTKREEAEYNGYDKAWRQLFNHVAQGGTADIVKMMMLRSQSICDEHAARLLLQIHDELVFEVPDKNLDRFLRQLSGTLELPPSDDFHVPIVVEPKVGKRFGELKELSPCGT